MALGCCIHDEICAEPVGALVDECDQISCFHVDRFVCPDLPADSEPLGIGAQAGQDDAAGAVNARHLRRHQTDGAGTDDDHGIARANFTLHH